MQQPKPISEFTFESDSDYADATNLLLLSDKINELVRAYNALIEQCAKKEENEISQPTTT